MLSKVLNGTQHDTLLSHYLLDTFYEFKSRLAVDYRNILGTKSSKTKVKRSIRKYESIEIMISLKHTLKPNLLSCSLRTKKR